MDLLFGDSPPPPPAPRRPLVQPGDAMPAGLSLASLSGDALPLSELWREAGALLVIGHGECNTSRLTFPFVDRLAARLADRDRRKSEASAARDAGKASSSPGPGPERPSVRAAAERASQQPPRVALVMQEAGEGAAELATTLQLSTLVLREDDPYPLAEALGLRTVPTLLLIDREGRVERMQEGFDRDQLDEIAAAVGLPGSLFLPEDTAPRRRPG